LLFANLGPYAGVHLVVDTLPPREDVAVIRAVDDTVLAPHPAVYGADPHARAVTLTRALATSPLRARLGDAVALVVRPGTPSLIGVLGAVPTDERPLVEAIGWHVDRLLRRLRPMPYTQVEEACQELAVALRQRVGATSLRDLSVVPLPRGGLIVAALLAYALEVAPERIGRVPASGRVILVDDCVLSGARLQQWLRAHPDVDIIAVHLASSTACREALRRHPQVIDSIAAVDLRDHAADYDDDWHRRWGERAVDALWVGDIDHVVFPWNEPESSVWNPARQRGEHAWRVVPPSWCLKNRVQGGRASEDIQLNVVDGDGPVRPSDDVLWAELGEGLLVATPGVERGVRLRGIAAHCWRAVVEHGHPDRLTKELAEQFDVPEPVVREDVGRLLDGLAERGLVRVA
jgi:hypothetical protein